MSLDGAYSVYTYVAEPCSHMIAVLMHLQGTMYEKLWHLVIPPLMTLLDDYEVSYKLRGSQIVLLFLQRVPADILRRTGIDGLLWMVRAFSR